MWHMGEKQNAYGVEVGKPEEKRQFARLVVHGRILLLKLVMKTYYKRVWTGFSWLRTQKSGQVL